MLRNLSLVFTKSMNLNLVFLKSMNLNSKIKSKMMDPIVQYTQLNTFLSAILYVEQIEKS